MQHAWSKLHENADFEVSYCQIVFQVQKRNNPVDYQMSKGCQAVHGNEAPLSQPKFNCNKWLKV